MRSKLAVMLLPLGVLYGSAAILKETPPMSFVEYEGLEQVDARRMDAAQR